MFKMITLIGPVVALIFSLYPMPGMAKTSVLELTDDDFSSTITQHETLLVMFYAPWCGHCKKLKPEFDKASVLLESSDEPITLAKVDCTEAGKETCGKFQISGYPTLKIFSHGEFSKDYTGPRDADGIAKYMLAQAGPSSKELSLVSQLDALSTKKDVTVIGYFPKETDLKGTFLSVANKLREKVNFVHTAAADLLAKTGVTGDSIQLLRPKFLGNKFEDSIITYSGSSKTPDIESWIKENLHGLVGYRTTNNVDDFKPPIVVAYFNVDYEKNPKGTNYWRNRILKVAKEHDGQFKFAISAKDDFQHELNEFGLDYKPSEKPVICARGPNNEKYIMKEEFSVEALKQFVSDLEAGKLVAYLKSEEPPADNEGPVKVAVASNFNEVVIENGKDTLIEFYAPWCGHCKKLIPTYEKLATQLKDENVAIVKMDATANDVPQPFAVQGFPTLFWLPKDKKTKPVPYDGGRNLEDFMKFIAKHATDELKGYDRKGKPKFNDEL